MAEVDVSGLDPSDPDYIAAKPPAKAIDAKTYFQVGTHAGQWSEYDERGVPTKNIKKKKPSKKEQQGLEAEYLEASKTYQKYLKDVESWEQAKADSEKALKKSDRLRWSFRQVGQKHEPINADEMEAIIKLMGWKPLSAKDFKVVKKGLGDIVNSSGQIELEALRKYVREDMPMQLLEARLLAEQIDAVDLEDVYSPRTWRGKLEEDPPPMKRKAGDARKNTKKVTATRGGISPRGAGKKSTLRKEDMDGESARGGGKKATQNLQASARGSSRKGTCRPTAKSVASKASDGS